MLRSTGGRRTYIVIRSSPSLTGQFRIVRDEVAWSHGGTLRVLKQILAQRLTLSHSRVIDDLRMLVRSVYEARERHVPLGMLCSNIAPRSVSTIGPYTQKKNINRIRNRVKQEKLFIDRIEKLLDDTTMNAAAEPPPSSSSLPALEFRRVAVEDLPAIIALESSSYPSDEAASAESLWTRQECASEYFFVVQENSSLVGFICGTRADSMTAESMTTHVPSGRLLAIHSVAVEPSYRRRGVATFVLEKYITEMKKDPSLEKLVLLAKAHLLALYVNVGFKVLGPSPIVHGKETWFDLQMTLVDVSLPCFIVNAFCSDRPGSGNPAAVVVFSAMDHPKQNDQAWMQRVAAQFNLSETAFVWPQSEPSVYEIRYFTPQVQVDLCGHATLASAAVLFQLHPPSTRPAPIHFRTVQNVRLSTELDVGKKDRPGKSWIQMEFPCHPPTPLATEKCPGVIQMLQRAFAANNDTSIWYSDTAIQYV
jgi:ribosomal protein S18 acetylase RimI-like enzyme